MTYPPHIPGSWQFSGDWLGCYRHIDGIDLDDPLTSSKDITCPVCEYPEAVHLSRYNLKYPLHYWCPACETVWQWYVAKCPDCGVATIWKKGCSAGTVECSLCNTEFDQEFIQEINATQEFFCLEE